MVDNKIIFSMIGVSKVYKPSKTVLKDIYLSFYYGAKIGVLGLNGAGKSSLLKIIAGLDQDYLGQITSNKDVTFGYLSQEPEMDPEKTVKDIVEEGVQETVNLLKEYEAISAQFADPDADFDALMNKQAKLQEQIDHANAWDLDSRLELAMDALRCPPGDTKINVLSGGEKRRVALCRLLLQQPDVLLLDEPTNHLDAETVAWLEVHLHKYPGTISWIMWPDGFWNSIEVKAFHLKETILHGSIKNKNVLRLKKNKSPQSKKSCSKNWNGCA
jgi:ATPase subunit of ABC transporter with duplicated ATPase domains